MKGGAEMQLREVMSRDVEVIGPDATLAEAAQRMRDGDFGMLPVGENDRMIGAITDRDMVVRCLAEGLDPKTAKVREAMSEGIDWCFEDDDVAAAAEKMRGQQIRRLPVVSRDKRLVGIVALGDLATEQATKRHAGAVLSGVSQGAHH